MRPRNEWLKPIAGLLAGAVPTAIIFLTPACQTSPDVLGPEEPIDRFDMGEHVELSMPPSCPEYLPPTGHATYGEYIDLGQQALVNDPITLPLPAGDVQISRMWTGRVAMTEGIDDRRAMKLEYHGATADGRCLQLQFAWEIGPADPEAPEPPDDGSTPSIEAVLAHAGVTSGITVTGARAALWGAEAAFGAQFDVDLIASYDDPTTGAVIAALGALDFREPMGDDWSPYSHDCGCLSQREHVENLRLAILAEGGFATIIILGCAFTLVFGPAFLACIGGALAFFAAGLAITVHMLDQALRDLACCSHTVASVTISGGQQNCADSSNKACVFNPDYDPDNDEDNDGTDDDGNDLCETVQISTPHPSLPPPAVKHYDCCYVYLGQNTGSPSIQNPPCKGKGCGGRQCGQMFENENGDMVVQQCPMQPCPDDEMARAENIPPGACEQAAAEMIVANDTEEGEDLDPDEVNAIQQNLIQLRSCKVAGFMAVACECAPEIGGNVGGGGGGGPPMP